MARCCGVSSQYRLSTIFGGSSGRTWAFVLHRAQRLMRGRPGILDGLDLVGDEKVEAARAQAIEIASHHAVRRQHDPRVAAQLAPGAVVDEQRHVGQIVHQLLAPVVEHRRGADDQGLHRAVEAGHGADQGHRLMRLAEAHVVAQQAPETVLLQELEMKIHEVERAQRDLSEVQKDILRVFA